MIDDIEEVIIVNLLRNDVEEAEQLDHQRPRRWRQHYEYAFDLSEEQFLKNYRLSKNLTRQVIELVTPLIQGPSRISAVNVETKVRVEIMMHIDPYCVILKLSLLVKHESHDNTFENKLIIIIFIYSNQ